MSQLAKTLTAIILLGTLMGAGPGLVLISPAKDAPDPATILGIPVIYAWVVFWFAVQAVAIYIASEKLWKPKDATPGASLDKQV